MPPSGQGRGGGGGRRPYWTAADRGIDRMSSEGVEVNLFGSQRTAQKFAKTTKELSNQANKSVKDNAVKSANVLRTYFGTVLRDVRSLVKSTISDFNILFGRVGSQSAKLDRQIAKQLARRGGGRGFNPFDDDDGVLGGIKSGVGNEMKQLVMYAGKLIPAMAALGGVAIFLKEIFEAMLRYSDSTRDLVVATGGATHETKEFVKNLIPLQDSTWLSTSRLIELSGAFFDAGVSTREMNKDILGFVGVAGRSVTMFGLADHAAAKYFRTMKKEGIGFDGMDKEISAAVGQMASLGLTTRDVSAAFEEANYTYEQYGNTLGKNISEFRDGFGGMKKLFKDLNMDAGKTGKIFNDLMAGGGSRGIKNMMRQAAFITQTMGGTYAGNFKMLTDPNKGSRVRGKSALMQLAQLMGPQASFLAKTQDQMTDQEFQSGFSAQEILKEKVVGMGYDNDMLTSYMTEFRNKMKAQGGPKGSILSEIAKFTPQEAAPDDAGALKTMDDVIKAFKRDPGLTLARIQNRIAGLVDTIAMTIEQNIPQLFEKTNEILDQTTNIYKEVAKITQGIFDFFGWMDRTFAKPGVSPMHGLAPNVDSSQLEEAFVRYARSRNPAKLGVNSSAISAEMDNAVGKQMWKNHAEATKQGMLGCATTVSQILRNAGVPMKDALSVDEVAKEMQRMGATKMPLADAAKSGQPYVIIKKQGGSHTGLGIGNDVTENSTALRKVVRRDISESSLKSGSYAYLLPKQYANAQRQGNIPGAGSKSTVGSMSKKQMQAIVANAAMQYGIPPAAAFALIDQENAAWNPNASGDSGKAMGLFQQHPSYGSISQRSDVATAANAAMKNMAHFRKKHPSATWGAIAAHAQRPKVYGDGMAKGMDVEDISYAKAINEGMAKYGGSPIAGIEPATRISRPLPPPSMAQNTEIQQKQLEELQRARALLHEFVDNQKQDIAVKDKGLNQLKQRDLSRNRDSEIHQIVMGSSEF